MVIKKHTPEQPKGLERTQKINKKYHENMKKGTWKHNMSKFMRCSKCSSMTHVDSNKCLL